MSASAVKPRSSPGLATHGESSLSLRFERNGEHTALVERYGSAPFHVSTAGNLADGTLVVQVTVLGPGIAAGDRLTQRIAVGPGAHAIVLFTSANKVLGSSSGAPARQDISIEVADTGALEYYPGLTIPFPDSAFEQRTSVDLSPRARFGILELWAVGRVQRDELFKFASIDARTDVRIGDRPAYTDTLLLERRSDIAAVGLMEGASYAASGYWCWEEALPPWEEIGDELVMVTGVPPSGHLYLRGLSTDGVALRRAARNLLARQRQAWGLTTLHLERYAPAFA